MAKNVKRLLEQFAPEHYDVVIAVDKKTKSFTGNVTVSGKKVGRPSKRLTFHQNGLSISGCEVTKFSKTGEEKLNVTRINKQKSLDEVRFHFDQIIYPGKYKVKASFSGSFSKDMLGLYESTLTHKGKVETILATQFESHHARKVFPCIDEPSAKATFQLTLSSPADEVALSNTPIESEKVEKNTRITTFEITPKMSTYLLAFATGKLHCVEAKAKDGTIIRSWASIERDKTHLQYSADEAVKILDFFVDYFKTPFPLKKCDLLALPDFDVGAMENWGLITFREIVMLADPKNRSISGEQYVSLVVAHELSHQWFGNLVTMKWWDELWLNESFASLMEHIPLDNLHPDWHQWELYTSMDVLSTTSRDIYKDIQPVSVEVKDPEIIETLFDPGIVYAKGGRLLKMLIDYIGEDAFRDGLRQYFKDHAYGNTSRDDLWDALSKTSGKNLTSLMDEWITKPGMPILHIKNTDEGYEIEQERFSIDDTNGDNTLWPIPLLADKPISADILRNKKAIIKTRADTLFNTHGSGHFVTHYMDKKQMSMVAKALHDDTMSAEGRINTLNDLYLLARRGDISIVEALEIVIANKPEKRNSVWGLMLRIIGACSQLTEGDKEAEDAIKKLKLSLASSHFDSLGLVDTKTDDPNTKQQRRTMAAIMVGSDDPNAIKSTVDLYKKAGKLTDIPSEIRGIVLSAAVKTEGLTVIDELLKAYKAASPDLQQDICEGLSTNRDKELAKHIYKGALGEMGFVKPQDLIRWLVYGVRNHHVRDVVWDYIVENWKWIEKTIGGGKTFDYLPTYMASVVSTTKGKAKYLELFEAHRANKVLSKNIGLGLADIDARIAWRKRDEQKIKQYLSDYKATI